MQTNKTLDSNTATAPLSISSIASGPWITVFPMASAALLVLQPTALATMAMAASLSLAMMAFALLSVQDEKSFDAKSMAIKLLAPVQFAFLIWLSVYAGRELAGASFAVSCLAAFAALAAMVVADALASTMLLLTAERGHGSMGVPVASLISAKYAGLLGKID
jgi:hypothetical protein